MPARLKKKLYNLTPDIVAGLRALSLRLAEPEAVIVRRALRSFLIAEGVMVEAPRRRAQTRRRG